VRGREYPPYLMIAQGIYSTNTETIRKLAEVRDGMCGAPFVLLKSESGDPDDIGGIGGFSCFRTSGDKQKRCCAMQSLLMS
jgi:hypothetical protein